MSVLDIARQAAEQGTAIHLTYKGEDRQVSPTAVQIAESTGNTVLIGIEPNKGWRKYAVSRVKNIELTSIPHENTDEIDLDSFVQAMLND